MIPGRVVIHAGCILLCALLAGTGPADALLDEAASVDDVERLEQAVFGPDEATPESEMRRRVAWALLATGRDRAALRQFARLAGRDPDAGGPKIGYALSAARLGDLTNAARAARRVLRVDPDAFADVPMDEALYARLETLRTRYMKRLARFDHDRDGAVMLATVCYLLDEPDTARYAIGYLTANGERGEATANLDRLVRERANPPAVERIAALVDEPSPELTPEPTAQESVTEPSETVEDALTEATDHAAEPAADDLEFKLVFRDDLQDASESKAAPVAVPATAKVTVGDPWAPVSADTLKVPPPAPKPVPLEEVSERYEVDYDKLHEDLSSVGGALDTFTQKLIRNIAAAQEKK